MKKHWDATKAETFLHHVRDRMAAGTGMSDRTFERMALLSNPDSARTMSAFASTLRRVGWSERRINRAIATVRPRTKVMLHIAWKSSKSFLSEVVDALADLGEGLTSIRKNIPPIAIFLLVVVMGIATCVHPDSDTIAAFLLSCGLGAGYIFGRAVDRPSKR